ncbi:FAD-binding and (Fe-S)-binding domain-containing protein [Nocardioides sp. HM23]|uniref:FAD-binding and (Fe-S)-binding domain-containing protein n=1 Tax=Nocardioides bizhenqiangii TaxID=3095076 RepID=UPI002AC9F94F|nr:FAD-binding and (Fe-S)-binding domain-containing protein [Nocardioides sp. HM23]MDZ5622820.1 FAD-binding and (Fe-S)-binding domain-containing protein [Nocardioides sp. HM23]
MSSADDLVAELARRGVDADDSTLTRALYSSDASLYRVLPAAVARPRHRDDLEAVLEVAAAAGSSVTMRGAGTSIAGNAVGEGIVVDTRRLDRVLEIDTLARTARVEPGVVHAQLQRAAAAVPSGGLRYGPDPSTHTRCTIGGMVGNNACGSRALGYGRTADTIVEVDVLWGDRTARTGEVEARLAAVVARELAHVRTSFGRFSRQVSGYSLEHLLPERLAVPQFFAGSEGTLGLLREVVVSLVPEEARDLLVLGYPSMVDAADAVPAILGGVAGDARIVACEGLDARIVELVRARGGAVPELPRGSGWLFVEVAGPERAGALSSVVAVAGALDARVVGSVAEAAALWRIREDGAGLAARSLGRPAHSGWEDAAVPPDRLGAWLRDFDALLREHRLDGVPYGHFGDGCVHVRIDFDFSGGPQAFREFLVACAERLREHGGSLSGEHGDGRARSELLPLMYDETSLALFAAVKHACDPKGLLNPGVLVDPRPFDADLRPVRPVLLAPDLAAEVHRCTGVGKCVAPAPAGVMCPSYVATRDEKDSTRGRARVLQEAVTGALPGGLADPAVHEALDLCLSCKGCLSDCPTGVDMAEYKSEVLHQTYSRRRRPRSHYALGALPRWARWGAPLARLGNPALRGGPLAKLAKVVAGVDERRSLPVLASPRFRKASAVVTGRLSAGGGLDTPSPSGSGYSSTETPDVWVWADSFTEYFRTGPGLAAIGYLEGAGLTVRVIDEPACCALTWTSTGQRDTARKILDRTREVLTPYVDSGVPVLGIEPSCTAALRSDAGLGVVTLGELVTRLDLPLPDLNGVSVVAQPHCHHSSVLGWATDHALLERAGATVTVVPGCCGLAGNWGVEKGHYEASVAVAESHLLPAVRSALEADPATVVLADGLSCALQLDDLAQVQALHLAELLGR